MEFMDIYKGSQQIVEELNNKGWMVHLNICPYKTFEELIEHGFDPNKWENDPKNNGNKIFIENTPFREYNKK